MRHILAAVVVLLLGLVAAPALAQDDARAKARELGDRGFELFQERRFEEANAHFRRAEALFHAPTLQLMIARTYERLDQLADAAAMYRQIVEEELSVDAPDAWRDAQRTAGEELATLTPRVPKLVFTPAADVSVTIAGQPAPLRPPDAGGDAEARLAEANPGSHAVRASRAGTVIWQDSVTVAEGELLTIELPPLALQPPPPAQPSPPEPGLSGIEAGAVAALVVGGLGLVAGAVGGIVAIDQQSQLDAVCPDKRCDPEDELLFDRAVTAATISTVGFVTAGVGVLTGVLLLTVVDDDEVALRVGPAGVVLEGRL